MQCYMCYKSIEDGDLEKLKEYQCKCALYKGNQCSDLPVEDSVGDKALKAAVALFPHFLKGKLPALCLAVVLIGLYGGLWALSLQANQSEQLVYDEIISTEIAWAEMSNRELIQFHNSAGNNRSSLEILNRAEIVPQHEWFGKARDNPDILIRLHGYITSMQTDFLFGSYITVGSERIFSHTDLYINFDNTLASVGDEVIIFLIPVFAGYDTPLRSWEWTQLK